MPWTWLLSLASLIAAPPAPAQSAAGSFVHESWSVRDGLPTNLTTAILQSRTGYLWIATFDGLVRFDGVRFTVFNMSNSPGLTNNRIISLHETSDTTLWLMTELGDVIGYRDGRFTRRDDASMRARLSNNTAGEAAARAKAAELGVDLGLLAGMVVDHEGSIWLATRANGLHRFKPGLFTTYGEPEGLREDNVYALAEDRAGAVWTGQIMTVVRVAGNKPTQFPLSDSRGPSAVFVDRRGRMWFADHVCDPAPPRCARAPGSSIQGGVRAIHEFDDGTLWFGADAGLFELAEGRRGVGASWRKVGIKESPRAPVRAFATTRDGALWLATNGDGIARYHNGAFRRITTAEGLPTNLVRALYVDADGILWVGTEGRGLARIDPQQPGRITNINQQHGLYDDGIHAIVEDARGRMWFNTNRGIFWVTRSELNDVASGKLAKVRATSYTERHGLRNREGNGGTQGSGIRTRDGRLWFATQGGIVVVDPDNVGSNRVPPKVAIEDVTRSGDKLRDVGIQYTALSFLAPENVRFRYKLEGYDRDWIEADTRRTAFYTKVPPGHYTFRVAAANDAGVWNEQGAARALVIAPLFYETWWFKTLAVLAALLLMLAVVRARIRQVRIAAEAEQLRALDQAKSRFFANVSHEFRTPLTLTIGPLEDARAQLAGTGHDDVVSRIDMALRSARRLFTLVTQVLDVAKVEAGSMKLHARPGDLVVFARGVAASFETLAQQKHITFDVVAPIGEVTASFDPDALEKVITNLLSNAFKFTPDDGRISLTVERADNRAVLTVADSGPGIPQKDLPHVFERFYQVDESNTRAQVGTGIGLALTRELVELHGGTIVVASPAAGGATFTISLPIAATQPATTGSGDDVTTILVVDDSADMRAYVRARLEQRYRVIEAGDGGEGSARAREAMPDLVISDVMMPVADGYQLVEELRASSETDFLPIILLTAQSDSQQRVTGFERGADDYITKPFDMRELEARVDNLIASRRRLRDRFMSAPAPEVTPSPTLPHSHTPTLSGSDKAFIDRLNNAVEANLANPDFGVAELAAAVFQDRTTLFRRTKELLDETPSELLRRVRLERATQLLTAGEDGIADVAYAVGFNSLSAFYRQFREVYGKTPAEFRGIATR